MEQKKITEMEVKNIPDEKPEAYEEVLLTDADCLAEVEDFNESYQALKSIETDAGAVTVDIDSVIAPYASFLYDRIAAGDWARKNRNAATSFFNMGQLARTSLV